MLDIEMDQPFFWTGKLIHVNSFSVDNVII
jgi:hypothetical protein